MSSHEKTCPNCGSVLLVYEHFVDAPAKQTRCPRCRGMLPSVDDGKRWCAVNQRYYPSSEQLQLDILRVVKPKGPQIFARGKIVRLETEFGYIEPFEEGPARQFALTATNGGSEGFQVGDLVSYEERGRDRSGKVHHTPMED